MHFYEDTRTGGRFQDARPDLADIVGLHLKRIEADGTEVKPKVSLPITPEKIKSAKAAMSSSTLGSKKAAEPNKSTTESTEED